MTRQPGRFILALVLAVPLSALGCQREGPPTQSGAQNQKPASGTLNPVGQAADTVTGTSKMAIDRAHQAESALNRAAQNTADQVQRATE